MTSLSDLKGNRQFAIIRTTTNVAIHAEFLIDGENSFVKIYSNKDLGDDLIKYRNIEGNLSDGTKISFIDNIAREKGRFHKNNEDMFYITFEPNWISLGDKFLRTEDRLKSISVLTDDAKNIYYDFDAFGSIINVNEYIDEIIKIQEKRLNRKIGKGPRPEICYFTGKHEITSIETKIGKISASHHVELPFGGSTGVSMRSDIYTRLHPDTPISLPDLFDNFRVILRFLEIIAGRRQNILHIFAFVEADDLPRPLEIYWCLWAGRPVSGHDLQPSDLPVNGGIEPEEFGRVLAGWIEKDTGRQDARLRFSEAFSKQNRYSIERLVGAANMFDILPDDAVPPASKLTQELLIAQDQAQILFKALQPSPERDSVLSALGRIGTNNLKKKIRRRAEILLNAANGYFPDLILVVDKAVDCRNHYVHGSQSKINYAEKFGILIPYFTNTLEFVFSVSEFIEIGWNFCKWRGNGTTMSHPWGEYVVTYRQKLDILKSCLEK